MTLEDIKKIYEERNKPEKLVAFIDILGFKNKVEKDTDSAAMLILMMELVITNEDHEGIDYFSFSDCMYLVCEKEQFHKLVRLLSCIQQQLLGLSPIALGENERERLADINLIRGAITYGEIFDYDNDNEEVHILLGKAVNRAYLLESKAAKFPRVILDEELAKCLQKDSIEMGSFKKDEDEQYYLDFFKFFYDREETIDMNRYINRPIQYIDSVVEEEEETVQEKLLWFRGYLSKSEKYILNFES